jgi:hypothetical protein
MLLVIPGEHLGLGGLVGNWGIERRLRHGCCRPCQGVEHDATRQGAPEGNAIVAP